MFIGSDNQFRNLYVMKSYKASESALAAVGDATLKVDTAKNTMYLVYKDTEDNLTSDIIDLKNLLYVKSTKAADMARKLNSQSVTLNADPVSGQDYVLNVEVRNFVALGDDSTHIKFGAVHAVKGMTKSDFCKAMALNLAKNLSREVSPILNVSLNKYNSTGTTNTKVAVLVNGKIQNLAALTSTETYTSIIIDEVEQPWRLGVMEQTPVYFEVQPVPITVNGDERIWGKVEDTDPAGIIANGKKIADLEYFCMGERGDMYRGVGYPNNIPTTYLVDPTVKYNVIDIHYAYVGSNESVQKSEKTITLVVPKIGAKNNVSNALANNIIAAINTATGLTITELDKSAS